MTTALFTLQEFATVTKTGHEGGLRVRVSGCRRLRGLPLLAAQPPAQGCLSNGNEFPCHLYPAINIGKPYNKLPPLATPSSHLLPATSRPQFMVVVGRRCGGRAVCIRLGMYDPTTRHCAAAHVLISNQSMAALRHLPFFSH